MSQFWQEAIPVFVMFGVVLALIPFVGFAMTLALKGDAMREREAAERVAARARREQESQSGSQDISSSEVAEAPALA